MPWLWADADHAEATTLRVDVPAQTVAFINGGTEDRLWGRVYPDQPGVERRAVSEFVATALAAVAIAVGAGPVAGRPVTVVGDGLLAQLIRASLPTDVLAPPGSAPLQAAGHAYDIIDTTGSARVLGEAVRTLPRVGRLILAAPPGSADITFATYLDIHVRALSLIGVRWAGTPAGPTSAELAQTVLTGIRHARPGQPAPRSLLYALDGRTSP